MGPMILLIAVMNLIGAKPKFTLTPINQSTAQRSLLLGVGALLDLNSGLAGDDAHVDHVHEEAMVDNSLQRQDGLGGSMAVLDGVLGIRNQGGAKGGG